MMLIFMAPSLVHRNKAVANGRYPPMDALAHNGPNHPSLKMLSDRYEDGPLPCCPTRRLRTVASQLQNEDGQPDRVGTAHDPLRCQASQEDFGKVHSDHAHAARITNLGLLTAAMAHEVSQPLAAIITNGETCLRWLDRAEPDTKRGGELAKRVIADARRASEIVARIRTMAKPKAPRCTPLSLNEIIEESLVFLRHEFQSRDIVLSLDLASDLPRVVGDRTQMQQVVLNLAVNAAQAVTDPTKACSTILVRTALSTPGMIHCSIEDDGPGIESAQLPNVFGAFFTTKDSGIGLGLPISRSIIEAHGGWIAADNGSALGGARFSFALPANVAN
jgi:signal transduction histidine kinase